MEPEDPVPEPFRTALATFRAHDVVDAPAQGAGAHFARGTARCAAGRYAEARADFEAARTEIGQACEVELALLDLLERRDAEAALAGARAGARRSPPGTAQRARARLVEGQALAHLRYLPQAMDALLEARRIYASLDQVGPRAQVLDVLGSLEASRGRLDQAVHHLALALVDKASCGDRPGMAITLGNLGRVHLQAERYDDAIECFERDLALARSLGDVRGIYRMQNDLGRTRLAQGDLDGAERDLRAAVQAAASLGSPVFAAYPQKDLALLHARRGDGEAARAALREARRALPQDAPAYLLLMLVRAEGEVALAAGDPGAVPRMEEAVRGYADLAMPDQEIETRIALAEALFAAGRPRAAEDALREATEIARRDGFARYLPALNEAMRRLDLVQGLTEESGRLALGTSPPPEHAYTNLELLGAGSFGRVHRAFDPLHDRVIALKVLELSRLYDPDARHRILASARRELHAASRVRHPGVVRVHAIGETASGDAYVVMDLVEGTDLRAHMQRRPRPGATEVLALTAKVAAALDALHQAGVVHRDLKPENVLLRQEDMSPVLVDFGIAHIGIAHMGRGDGAAAGGGTPAYMAPEQRAGRPVDGRADLYALGVMAYEWLAGHRPTRERGGTVFARIRSLGRKRTVPLQGLRPDLPLEVATFVDGLLAFHPRRRPQSAARVAARAEHLARLVPAD